MQKNGKELPLARPRSGQGAASVIPHLNDVIPLEPSQLRDEFPEEVERAEHPGDGTDQETNAAAR